MTAEHEQAEPANKHERKWALPKKLFGRARTSTVILGVAFVATLMLYGHFNPDPPDATDPGPVVPAQTSEAPKSSAQATTSKPAASTTSAVPSTPAEETVTSTPSPAIVLPPWLTVPSGMELPPGVVTATSAAPPTPPAPTP